MVCSTVHLLKDICVAGFFPVWRLLTNTDAVNICEQVLSEHKFSFRWDRCPGLQLLACMVVVCLVCSETAKQHCGAAVPFYLHTDHVFISDPVFPYPFLCVVTMFGFHFSYSR